MDAKAWSEQDILDEFCATVPQHAQQSLFTAATESAESSAQSLDKLSQSIIVACKRPAGFDELQTLSGLHDEALHEKLFDLALDGHIEQNFAGMWHAL